MEDQRDGWRQDSDVLRAGERRGGGGPPQTRSGHPRLTIHVSAVHAARGRARAGCVTDTPEAAAAFGDDMHSAPGTRAWPGTPLAAAAQLDRIRSVTVEMCAAGPHLTLLDSGGKVLAAIYIQSESAADEASDFISHLIHPET